MLGGVLILYLPLNAAEAVALTGLVLIGMGVALYATRQRVAASAKAGETAGRIRG